MKIITVPHQRLRATSRPVERVDRQLRRLLTDLQTTLIHSDIGVGLAAPQIDSSLRVFAVNLPDKGNTEKPMYRYFINPLITKYSKETAIGTAPDGKPDLEGCLSVPKVYAPISRPVEITVEYQTLDDGELCEHQETFAGFAARVFQHEYDHLDGRLFTDLALSQHQQLYLDDGDQLTKITPADLWALFGGEF